MADDEPPAISASADGVFAPERNTLQQIEHSIDSVDWLRRQMRSLGAVACADALDEAFAHCLRAYLELLEDDGLGPGGKVSN